MENRDKGQFCGKEGCAAPISCTIWFCLFLTVLRMVHRCAVPPRIHCVNKVKELSSFKGLVCFYKKTGKILCFFVERGVGNRCMQHPLCRESRRALILMRMEITSTTAPSAPRFDGEQDKEM